jgi:hypothetical protein
MQSRMNHGYRLRAGTGFDKWWGKIWRDIKREINKLNAQS